ncbi:MBL fold metallo-hydrolase [Chelonobacter oris]|uniref:Beta-lactamase n=1 Tax=Chelonobacter oris TaxID=505317 RepID=A0A0A3ARE8_9PAST|nr:MBL fold metallo-hydrolase [Chelonobacter oris]KGQ69640.1 beta-lactamase [Chelonobacter oris]MDH3000297.1 MBL fold metallo-hydrolase [Chelonobacter oris]
MKSTVLTTFATFAFAASVHAETTAPLNLKVYNADKNSFSVTSTVVSGDTEALVIDSGFTRADALRIAANVLDSGKTLNTVLISNADPDFYFGAETLKQIFPQVKVVTTQAVHDRIKQKMAGKIAYWSPLMGNNAPKNPILPEVLSNNSLTVDGQKIEILGTEGILAHRPYVWIPSIRTISGNIGIFGDMHVWTADTQSAEERAAWIQQLEEMKALKPTTVIPGHMSAEAKLDASAINFTQAYLTRFESAVADSQNSAQIIATMEKAYPNLHGKSNVELGAKVVSGEMKW